MRLGLPARWSMSRGTAARCRRTSSSGSLTFEVIADADGVSAGAICAAVSRGRVEAGEADRPIEGFSAYGDSQRAVIEPLARATGGWPCIAGERLTLAAGPGAATDVADLGVGGDGGTGRRDIAAAEGVPRRVTLSYYDPARDYQAGLQQVLRPGAGRRVEAVELPAALSASAAKGLTEGMLARAEAERERRVVRTTWRGLEIAPGERVTIDGEPGLWRVADWSLEGMAVTLELLPIMPAPIAVPATAGRFLPPPDALVGDTILHAFELPHLGEGVLSAPRISIAACGTAAGWRRAALALSFDGGTSWEAAGSTAAPAIIGRVEVAAGTASPALADLRNQLIVQLAHSGMQLQDADTDAMDRGANLALVGNELVQFGNAEALGGGRWRLSRLWRGRRGTEHAIGTMASGDHFVLIEAIALAPHDVPVGSGDVHVMAVAPGNGTEVEQAALRNGSSLVPPCPVGLHAVPHVDGGLMLRWVRRSRLGWHWIDGADAPLAEEVERYQLRLIAGGGAVAEFETGATAYLMPSELRMVTTRVEVRQAGDHGLSLPAIIDIPPI